MQNPIVKDSKKKKAALVVRISVSVVQSKYMKRTTLSINIIGNKIY